MATIEEDYVSFETSKLLKEKGFMEGAIIKFFASGYDSQGNILDIRDTELKDYPRPTLQMAMKWLREVHKISIEITSKGYLIDNDAEWECDIKAGRRLYFKHITGEKSPESCADKAIKYCLENLI